MRLSTWEIAKRNFRRSPFRSFCLVLIIMLFSLLLFTGSVLSFSLANGAQSMANRLGADIMVVPAGFDPHVDNILLAGKPSTFYLPANAMDELMRIKDDAGIDLISPQSFLATLRASCCSYPVQLVGIEYSSDFIVKPWLQSTIRHDLREGEIIVGYRVSGQPGETLKFFNKDLLVAGRLEQTGMGFDAMIFMNRATLAVLSKEAERIIERPLTNDGSLTSVIMLKLKPGFSPAASAREINRLLNDKGIYALFSKKFVNSIGESLKVVSSSIFYGLIVFWVMAVTIAALIFAMTLFERKREFGILRTIGATRGKLIRLCLTEIFMVSSYGSLLGVVLGAVIIAVISPYMIEALKLPFLLPGIAGLAGLAVMSVVLSITTGLISGVWSAFKAGHYDIHEMTRGA
ncbi:MAG: ABC transporter permease [Synergistaceae bacterium]|nr:ABC transporter permease [Synergistaceae bacterium]